MGDVLDPRDRDVTITLTAREWDSLGFGVSREDHDWRRYAHRSNGQTRDLIARMTREGARERYELERAEADALRPDVLGNLESIKDAMRLYHEWWASGECAAAREPPAQLCDLVDDLMAGMSLQVYSHGLMVVCLPGLEFAGRYPYFKLTEVEVICLLRVASQVGRVTSWWNGWIAETCTGCQSVSICYGEPPGQIGLRPFYEHVGEEVDGGSDTEAAGW